MANLLRAVVQGLEATFDNNGVGGMASTFQLLEIAHTHYWLKDNSIRSDLSPMSERNSPLGGSRENLAPTDANTPSNPTSLPINMQSTNKQPTLASPTAAFVAQLGKRNVAESVRVENRRIRSLRKQNEHISIFSGNFWDMSKSVIARGYASAAQATMALAPTVEYITSPMHSFAPYESLLSPNTNPYASRLLSPTDSIMSNSVIEQTTGTEFYSLFVSLFV